MELNKTYSPRQDSTGTLKTTITLGKKPSVFQGGTFYLMKEPPECSELTGQTNLMAYHELEHSYNKFSSKKLKEDLSAFLPNLPGLIDMPGSRDNSSLKALVEKPPILGKEILPLSNNSLIGFRLHPGPLPEQYRYGSQMSLLKKKQKKHKKEIKEMELDPLTEDLYDSKKNKKLKKNEDERRKRKRDKRKKKGKERDSF